MASALRRRLTKGILAKGFGQGSQIVIRLAEVPLFLAFWGPQLYGEWLILAALPSYLAMSDFGFASATNRHMAMLVAKGRRDEALAAFQATFWAVLIMTLAIVLLFVAAVAILPVTGMFGFERIGPDTALIAMALLGTQVVISSQILLLYGGYYCEQRYPLGLGLMAVVELLQFGAMALTVMLDGGPVAVASAILIGSAIGLFIMRLGLYRITPWLRYGMARNAMSHLTQLWRPALASMAFPIGQAMSFQGIRLIIGAALGPAAVALFVTHRQLARLVTLIATLIQPVQAELSALFGAEERSAFRDLSRRSFQLLAILALFTGSGILLFSGPVFLIWTAENLTFSFVLLALLLAVSIMEGFWRAGMAPLVATNRHIRIASIYAGISAVLLPVAYACGIAGNLTGIALALIAFEMLMLVFTLKDTFALTQDRFIDWMRFMLTSPPSRVFFPSRPKDR